MHPDQPLPPDGHQDEIHELLASIDHPVPPLSATAIAALAETRARAATARRRTALRWAAAVLLTAGAAGVAVAAPGSPILRWVTALVAHVSGRGDRPAATPAAQGGEQPRGMAGIAVLPGDSFTVIFAAVPAGGVALVSFSEREEILVQARPRAARFTTEPDRLRIEARSAADTFAIEIPRTAARVEVRAGSARLLLAERGRIFPALAPDSLGRYHVSLPSGGH
jgi:hypothetical protein